MTYYSMILRRFKRLIYSCLAIFAGVVIVTISLFKTASVAALSELDVDTSAKQFYLDEPIRPDHVLYPVVVVKDHLQFAFLSPQERINRQIQLADQRLLDSQELLTNDQKDLAISTLVKAEQYLYLAAQEVTERPEELDSQPVIDALKYHRSQIEHIFNRCPAHHHPKLNQIIQKHDAILSDLDG